jgi:hypothetical protein
MRCGGLSASNGGVNLIETCGTCGVPLIVGNGIYWEGNGVISIKNSPKNRMAFFECQPIDQLFSGVEELIGAPLEHIVIESRSRETKRYIERAFPPDVRKVMEGRGGRTEGEGLDLAPDELEMLLATMKTVTQSIIDIGRAYGYGDQRMGGGWERGDDFPWRTQLIRHPYSILFTSADNRGSVEAFEAADMRVEYKEVAPDDYEIGVSPGTHAVALADRLKRKRYDFKPGDIEYERCEECGVPLVVSYRKWDSGTITDPDTDRRFAIFGPLAVDAVFEDLEAELGEAIPEVVIEAQRRYIKTAWDIESWNRDGATFQQMVALRGLGNITTFDGQRTHLTMVVENTCLHLLLIGTVQALVELAYKADGSTCEWELADDGDLTLTVTVNK